MPAFSKHRKSTTRKAYRIGVPFGDDASILSDRHFKKKHRNSELLSALAAHLAIDDEEDASFFLIAKALASSSANHRARKKNCTEYRVHQSVFPAETHHFKSDSARNLMLRICAENACAFQQFVRPDDVINGTLDKVRQQLCSVSGNIDDVTACSASPDSETVDDAELLRNLLAHPLLGSTNFLITDICRQRYVLCVRVCGVKLYFIEEDSQKQRSTLHLCGQFEWRDYITTLVRRAKLHVYLKRGGSEMPELRGEREVQEVRKAALAGDLAGRFEEFVLRGDARPQKSTAKQIAASLARHFAHYRQRQQRAAADAESRVMTSSSLTQPQSPPDDDVSSATVAFPTNLFRSRSRRERWSCKRFDLNCAEAKLRMLDKARHNEEEKKIGASQNDATAAIASSGGVASQNAPQSSAQEREGGTLESQHSLEVELHEKEREGEKRQLLRHTDELQHQQNHGEEKEKEKEEEKKNNVATVKAEEEGEAARVRNTNNTSSCFTHTHTRSTSESAAVDQSNSFTYILEPDTARSSTLSGAAGAAELRLSLELPPLAVAAPAAPPAHNCESHAICETEESFPIQFKSDATHSANAPPSHPVRSDDSDVHCVTLTVQTAGESALDNMEDKKCSIKTVTTHENTLQEQNNRKPSGIPRANRISLNRKTTTNEAVAPPSPEVFRSSNQQHNLGLQADKNTQIESEQERSATLSSIPRYRGAASSVSGASGSASESASGGKSGDGAAGGAAREKNNTNKTAQPLDKPKHAVKLESRIPKFNIHLKTKKS